MGTPALPLANVDRYFTFLIERQRILLRRLAGQPKPWTEDRVLRDHHFTCVFREDDRVTRWVRENIREPFADHEHLFVMLAIARYLNWPDSLAELIKNGAWPSEPGFEPSHLTAVLEARHARGDQLYTGAYMIRAENNRSKPWFSWPKHRYVAEIVLGGIWGERERFRAGFEKPGQTLHGAFDLFANSYGWGGFMAYEVICDARFTRYLRNASDVATWANAGPGAAKGLNELIGRSHFGPSDYQRPNKQGEMLGLMRQLLTASRSLWPSEWPAWELREVENGLCEFSKYARGLRNEKMKRRYPGAK